MKAGGGCCTRSGYTTEHGKLTHQRKANANLLLLAKRSQAYLILFLSFSEDKFVRWTKVSDDIEEQYLVNIRMYPKLIWLGMGVQQRKVITQFHTLCKKRRMPFPSNAKYKNMKSGENHCTASYLLCNIY